MSKAATSYLQTQIATTTPGELLIMLYDACVKNLRQAQDRIRERDYRNKGMLISKAIDIITELQSSLNANKGGSLAVNLQKLYFYCNTRLLKANMDMDTAIIDEVIKIITGIRDAYNQIVTQPAPSQAQSQAAPPAAVKAASAPTPAYNRPAAPAFTSEYSRPLAPALLAASAEAAAPAAAQEAVIAPSVQEVIPPRGPNQRVFAAYASAHKQGA